MLEIDPNCAECPLSGKQVGWKGNPNAEFVIVGQSPGREELRLGEPFVGPSGKLLHDIIPDHNIFVTNALRCCPSKLIKKDQNKMNKAVKCCQQRLLAEIKAHPRRCILTLGNEALWALTNNFATRIMTVRGLVVPSDLATSGIFPAIHPAALLRGTGNYRQWKEDLNKASILGSGGYLKEYVEPEYIEIEPRTDGSETGKAVAREIIDRLSHSTLLTCDLETSGFSAREDYILTVGITDRFGFSYDFPPDWLPELKDIFESKYIKWNWQNGKFDIQFLWQCGIEAKVDEDTLLLSYCLDENPGVHDLETISGEVLNSPDYKDMLAPYLPYKGASYSHVPMSILNKYMAIDVSNTHGIHEVYKPRVESDKDLLKLYTETLIPASRLLAKIESRGFYVDKERVAENAKFYIEAIAEKKAEMHAIVGYEFNPNSPQQMSAVLYDHYKLPNRKKRSTAAAVVAKLPQTPIVKALAKYRKITKAYSTYVKKVLDYQDSKGNWQPGFCEQDGRVHSTYLIHGTPTGRLASRKPNLQNIPREKRLKGTYCARPGMRLLEVDLSQAELRSLAVLSRDPHLMQIYKEGRSLHKEVAAAMFGEDYTPEQYVRAKAINFGIVYGRTPYTIADEFDIPVAEAQRMIDVWFERFPVAKRFIDKCRATPRTKSTMTTCFGRKKRYGVVVQDRLRDLMNEAANYPHQSIASDINLRAAMRVQDDAEALGAYIVNLVHDSTIFEIPDDDEVILKVIAMTQEAMKDIPIEMGLTAVPFESDAEIGPRGEINRWGMLSTEHLPKAA